MLIIHLCHADQVMIWLQLSFWALRLCSG